MVVDLSFGGIEVIGFDELKVRLFLDVVHPLLYYEFVHRLRVVALYPLCDQVGQHCKHIRLF